MGNASTDLFLSYEDKSRQLMANGLEEIAVVIDAAVQDLLNVAEAGAAGAVDTKSMFLINRAMDQILASGDYDVIPIYTTMIEELGAEATEWADSIGVSLEAQTEILMAAQVTAQSNNLYYIQSIIPPIRNEIGQIMQNVLANGGGVEDMIASINDVGLPWSETQRYSPGQRAFMIAHTEMRRISNSLNEEYRLNAGLEWGYNDLNEALKSHSAVCVAATVEGIMKKETIESRFGMPPRHPMCGCAIVWLKKDWYNKADTQRQLNMLRSNGIDPNAKAAEWNSKGPLAKQNKDKRRENAEWDNNFIENILGVAA